MHTIITEIPFDYVAEKRVALTWREVKYGIENKLVEPAFAIDLATSLVGTDAEREELLVDLAIRDRQDSVIALVDSLAGSETSQADDAIRDKWLFLVLSWIFDRRKRIDDVLGLAEQVYSDFGYPRKIARFIRYMPMEGPDLGSKEANEDRLMEYWSDYLKQESEYYCTI